MGGQTEVKGTVDTNTPLINLEVYFTTPVNTTFLRLRRKKADIVAFCFSECLKIRKLYAKYEMKENHSNIRGLDL